MWHYPKSALHQTAINAQKPEIDRAAARSLAAQRNLVKDQDREKALKDIAFEKAATLAKTHKLRSERLAREAEATPAKPKKR